MSDIINSKDYYNSISDHYDSISDKRAEYLNAINELIISDFKGKVKTILDVGSGDGKRAIYIYDKINAKELVLIDESLDLISKVKSTKKISTINNTYLTHDFKNQKFDLILCLWNVLGHVTTKDERIQFLKKMKENINTDGKIAIDFNNRFNYKEYGITKVIINYLRSFLIRDSGWFSLRQNGLKTKVYIHNIHEIKQIVRRANLRIDRIISVDYKTGEINNNINKGQIYIVLSK